MDFTPREYVDMALFTGLPIDLGSADAGELHALAVEAIACGYVPESVAQSATCVGCGVSGRVDVLRVQDAPARVYCPACSAVVRALYV